MNTKLNKSDYVLLSLYFVVAVTINVVTYIKNGSTLKEYLFDIPAYIFTTSVLIILLINWLIPIFIIKSKKYFQFFILSILILMFFGTLEIIVNIWSEGNVWYKKYHYLDVIFRRSIVMTAEQTAFPFALLLTKKFYEGKVEFSKIEKQQKENELKLLRSQLDPHFLFNNLNTLDSLIDSDTEKAKEYINRLSLIYRYLIKTKDAEVMELAEEIQLAENYMFLIKTRFGNDYDFKIEKHSILENKFIPTGALQALLENVVKHNKPQNGSAIKAIIFVEENRIKISNTKSNINTNNESFGTGLENLKARYQLLSDKAITIINTDKEFNISIPIIKLTEEN